MGLKRSRPTAAVVVMHALVASCLACLVSSALAKTAVTITPTITNTITGNSNALLSSSPGPLEHSSLSSSRREDGLSSSSSKLIQPQRLAVVVPAHRGDLKRAVSSLSRWPTNCVPLTQRHVDLVLYYAEGKEDEEAASALSEIERTAGRCFAETKLVYADLNAEEDVYPKGPSVQFYKMFLDEGVRSQLSEYDALAVIEWDVLVASERSFAELYRAAFTSAEDFWVKGSNLEGTNFHEDAADTRMWHVLGHINGNAIYNNNDPAFVEFVDFTLSRWEYKYPYDVALWATIADFPYSWPLWQRYSSKFVTTNLISNVGYEHVDTQTVSDAIAGQTLFIHGSSIDDGNKASIEATSISRRRRHRRSLLARQEHTEAEQEHEHQQELEDEEDLICGDDCANASAGFLAAGVSTVCDPTCAMAERGYLCGAGNAARFGSMCRVCYTNLDIAREAEGRLTDGRHVVMCDTMRPPPAAECSTACGLKKDTICDATCGTGAHGDYNCNWRGFGETCRFCFDDVEVALMADKAAKHHGGRVVMCDTHEPPAATDTDADFEESAELVATPARKLHDGKKWKSNRKWSKLDKWRRDKKWEGSTPSEVEPKYKNNRCLDGCERTTSDGKRGRVCDESCKSGDPYGTLGCNAKEGKYGRYCRLCYNDLDLAQRADNMDNRAIMCSTLAPADAYARRQLLAVTTTTINDEEADVAPVASRNLHSQKWKNKKNWEKARKWKKEKKWDSNRCLDGCTHTYKDGSRGRVCDNSCESGDPYGTRGCGAKDGKYGELCRGCFYDYAKAMNSDTAENRAIMCDTVLPVTVYSTRRLLSADNTPVQDKDEDGGFEAFLAKSALLPYTPELARGDLCAFIGGKAGGVEQTRVIVESVLEFMPGMRIAVAVEPESFDAYDSVVGVYPGVQLSLTPSARTSSLFADQHCGAGTHLIYYPQPGSILSRTFTSKDTHTPRGDLFVTYGDRRASFEHSELARQTTAVLGFNAPSFTFGTDLILPAAANAELREELLLSAAGDVVKADDANVREVSAYDAIVRGSDDAADRNVWAAVAALGDNVSMPQLMAALAYARNSEGVRFVNPHTWVAHHLFTNTSIWDVPLVKPRFSCSITPSIVFAHEDKDNAAVLSRNLDFFRKGGTCDNGLIAVGP